MNHFVKVQKSLLMETTLPEPIEKEVITELSFKDEEILTCNTKIKSRTDNLYNAMILGNGQRNKVKIVFDSHEGLKQVETTIWATTEKNIILKGGVVIPVNSIRDVRI